MKTLPRTQPSRQPDTVTSLAVLEALRRKVVQHGHAKLLYTSGVPVDEGQVIRVLFEDPALLWRLVRLDAVYESLDFLLNKKHPPPHLLHGSEWAGRATHIDLHLLELIFTPLHKRINFLRQPVQIGMTLATLDLV